MLHWILKLCVGKLCKYHKIHLAWRVLLEAACIVCMRQYVFFHNKDLEHPWTSIKVMTKQWNDKRYFGMNVRGSAILNFPLFSLQYFQAFAPLNRSKFASFELLSASKMLNKYTGRVPTPASQNKRDSILVRQCLVLGLQLWGWLLDSSRLSSTKNNEDYYISEMSHFLMLENQKMVPWFLSLHRTYFVYY